MKNLPLKKESEFRRWLQNKWYEHLDELDAWKQTAPTGGPEKYFQTYKWWLKREFRFQNKQESGT